MSIELTGTTFATNQVMFEEETANSFNTDTTIVFWMKLPGSITPDGTKSADVVKLNNTAGGVPNVRVSVVSEDAPVSITFEGSESTFGVRTVVSTFSNWADKWLMFAYHFDPYGAVCALRIYDQAGLMLDKIEWGNSTNSTIPNFVSICAHGTLGMTGVKVAEVALVKQIFTDQELSDIAVNHTLSTFPAWCYWPLTDANGGTHSNLGTEVFPLTVPAGWQYSSDNPSAPIVLNKVDGKGNGHIFTFDVLPAGTIYAVRCTNGGAVPSNAEIIAGGGASIEEATSVAVTANSQGVLEFSGAFSFTPYDYYFVHVSTESNEYRDLSGPTWTTCGSVSGDFVNNLEETHVNLPNINWAWFDTENANLMDTPTDKGTGITTNVNGGATFHLPGSSLTAGQKGTLVLDCNDSGSIYTGSYNLPVE